jgi:DNA-binding MarR family transcriptional regulator
MGRSEMAADLYAWDEKQLNHIYMTSICRLLFDLSDIDEYAGLEMIKEMGYPVSSAHLNVVPHIDIGGTRLTELAQRAHLTKQSTWESLKNMEAHGYIARTKDPSDARAILISWTPKGIEFLRVVCLGLTIREDDVAKRIGSKDAKVLKDLLTKVRDSYVRQPPVMEELVATLKAKRNGKRSTVPRATLTSGSR